MFDEGLDVSAVALPLFLIERQTASHVLRENVLRGHCIRTAYLHLDVQPAGPQYGGVDEILPVARADDDDVPQPFDAVDLGEELRHDRGFDVRRDTGTTGTEEGVHFVEEDDDRIAVRSTFLSLLENF